MSCAPREAEPRSAVTGKMLRSGGMSDVEATLWAEGLLHVEGIVSKQACSRLAAEVAEAMAAGRAAVARGAPSLDHFAEVLTPSTGLRHDLKLELSPAVREALGEALGALGPLLAALLGEDARLWELAALTSEPGAVRQEASSHP